MDQPAAPAPAGQESILVNPPNKIYLAIIVISVCLPLTTALVMMRVYTNIFIARRPRKDDILVSFCYFFFVVYCVSLWLTTKHGSFVNVWDLTTPQLIDWRKWAYAQELLYFVLLFLVKLSVLILYRRLFCPARGAWTWIHYFIAAIAVFNFMYYITAVFLVAFTCHPIALIWDASVQGTCLDIRAIMIASGAMDVISELLLISIPVIVFLRINLPRPEKYRAEVAILFASSLITLGFTIVGTYLRIHWARQPNISMNLSLACLWTFPEIVGAFTTTCLATTPEMVRHFRQSGEVKFKMPGFDTSQDTMVNEKKAAAPPLPWGGKPTHKVSVGEEDPYYMYDDFSGDTDADTINHEITVCTEWNVASIPKTHKGSSARKHDGVFNSRNNSS